MADYSQYLVKEQEPINITVTPEPKNKWSQYAVASESTANPDDKSTSQIDLSKALNALGQIESSGNYNALGVPVNGQRAIGKYQIMPANIPSWSKEALGKEISAEEFAANPELQDKIASFQVQKLIDKGHPIEDIPSIWLSGKPYAGNNRKDKGTGISVPDYMKKFMTAYNRPEGAQGYVYDLADKLQDYPEAAETIQKGGEAVRPYNEKMNAALLSMKFPQVAGGFFEGLGNAGISAANLPLEATNAIAGTDYKIPALNMKQFTPQETPWDAMAFEGGKLGGDIAGVASAYGALGKVAGIPKGAAAYLGEIGRGASAGYIAGDENPGGRELSAALGGALPAATGLSYKNIGNRLLEERALQEGQASQGYNKLFAEAPKEIKINTDRIKKEQIDRHLKTKYEDSFNDFIKNPTAETAHWAQSDLGKAIKDLEKAEMLPSGLSVSQKKSLKAMIDAKKRIRGALHTAFSKDDGKFSRQYQHLTKNYAANVAPYKNQKSLNLLKSGKKYEEGAINSLMNNREFMDSVGKKHKDLLARRILESLKKPAGALSALGLTGAAGYGAAKYY